MKYFIEIFCKDCRCSRLVDCRKNNAETYKKKYPRCTKCASIFRKNNPNVQKNWFKKGIGSWNKGVKRLWSSPTEFKKGFHCSPNTEFKKEQVIGEKNCNWKGVGVGYYALHCWMTRRYGKPSICEFCGKDKNIVWASKNYKYTRDRNDWLNLCRECHRKYDGENGWGIASKLYPEIRKDYVCVTQ